jgi:hypothetical protein
VFAAGQDALLQDLARRDAAKVAEEDRQRQIDSEQETSGLRQRQIGLQERQVAGQEADRAARISSAEQEVQADAQAKAEFDALIQAYVTAEPDSPEQKSAAIKLTKFGAKLPEEPKDTILSAGQVKLGPDNKPVASAPFAPRQGPQPKVPDVPTNIMRQIFALPKSVKDYDQAFEMVRDQIPVWMQENQNLDPKAVITALQQAYQYRPPGAQTAAERMISSLEDELGTEGAPQTSGEPVAATSAPGRAPVGVGEGEFAPMRRPNPLQIEQAQAALAAENRRRAATGEPPLDTSRAAVMQVASNIASQGGGQ